MLRILSTLEDLRDLTTAEIEAALDAPPYVPQGLDLRLPLEAFPVVPDRGYVYVASNLGRVVDHERITQ